MVKARKRSKCPWCGRITDVTNGWDGDLCKYCAEHPAQDGQEFARMQYQEADHIRELVKTYVQKYRCLPDEVAPVKVVQRNGYYVLG